MQKENSLISWFVMVLFDPVPRPPKPSTYSPILVLFPFSKILDVHFSLQSLISFSLNQSSGAEEVEVDMYLGGAGCKRCSCGKEGCMC